jgi:hypothetical protein
MVASRITPRIILIGLAVNLGAWLTVHLPSTITTTPHLGLTEKIIKTLFLCVAYGLALALNLEIAAEYRQTRWLRVAWMAMAVNAGVSFVRIIIESPLIGQISQEGDPLRGLLQHLTIVPANISLLIGLGAMWWAYHQVGLGFTIERRDYAAIGGILLLTCVLLYFREGLSEARSPYLASRILQLIGLVLLSLSAATGLVLHRMAMQMGGGKLAITLRFLTFYTLLRTVLVLIVALQRLDLTGHTEMPRFHDPVIELGWQVVPWIAALAAAYRAELIVQAAEKLAQQRAAKTTLVSV